ncbi:hypothetical protein B0T16DRAFT_418279 [Cercophora newfieldiana]|uniref:Uncharacterized protein n=1 Tax=Cercophora newfieldiana TaxID=92897 RepID=A0AA39XUW0_9PEZI|nr:hypothetical protein B0T16DRAFT_418279 [Cercophora newfieldiana]
MRLASLTTILVASGLGVSARDDVPCSATGGGTCNLGFKGYLRKGSQAWTYYWTSVHVYDNTCRQLGGLQSPHPPLSLTSQLPWTVEIKKTPYSGGLGDFEFHYAGQKVVGGFHCWEWEENYGSYSETLVRCKHAFNC